MRIYIDSADAGDIREALATGFVYGVTTNPTLLRRASVRADKVQDMARAALKAGAKEIHLQTYSDTREGICEEGRRLADLDPARVVVKIPATPAGYAATAELASSGLRVTLTAVYTVRQSILATCAGASYIAVYLGRMRDAGLDAVGLVGRMQKIIDTHHAGLEILAASVRDPLEVEDLAELGVATATLPLKVLHRLLESPATDTAAAQFLEDARAIM